MTIEINSDIKSVDAGIRKTGRSSGMSEVNIATATNDASRNAAEMDAAQVQEAASQLNSYLAARSSPPEFSIDYLSGLSVVTVRSVSTGETLYQLPGSEAVRLARLLKEGGSLDSFGALDTTV